MTDAFSDDFPDTLFKGFTDADFEKVDDAISAALEPETQPDVPLIAPAQATEASFESEIYGLNLNLLGSQEYDFLDEVVDLEDVVLPSSQSTDASFRSDAFSLNLGTLAEQDFAQLEAQVEHSSPSGAPLVHIEIDTPEVPSGPSPMKQFRHKNILSVTDLVSPSWYVFFIFSHTCSSTQEGARFSMTMVFGGGEVVH